MLGGDPIITRHFSTSGSPPYGNLLTHCVLVRSGGRNKTRIHGSSNKFIDQRTKHCAANGTHQPIGAPSIYVHHIDSWWHLHDFPPRIQEVSNAVQWNRLRPPHLLERASQRNRCTAGKRICPRRVFREGDLSVEYPHYRNKAESEPNPL